MRVTPACAAIFSIYMYLPKCWPNSIMLSSGFPHIIKYKLVKKLGPTNNPNQKITFPSTVLPLSSFVLESVTSGICSNCIVKRYPLTFLNKIAMQSS
jgi:hypothetical protein